MQPLSKRKRRIYLYGLILVFVVCLPFVIFYANGYRFKSGEGFVRTGSIIISVSSADAMVSLDGREVGTSGFLRHNFYIDNLTPGTHFVLVSREGDYPWYRSLVVEEELVTDAQAFLVSKTIQPLRLAIATQATTTTSTSTVSVSTTVYDTYRTAFATVKATSTPSDVLRTPASVVVVVEDGDVFVRWRDEGVLPPSNFCSRPSFCISEIPIEIGPPYAVNAALFGGGVVYATKEGGVFIAEPDIRPEPVVAPLYQKTGADFRIVDGHLIIKDGTAFYEIAGL